MLILEDSKDLWDIIENVDIDVEKSAQSSIVAKKTAIERDNRLWLWAQTSYTLQSIYFFVIMYMLRYWYDQEIGIASTGSYNFI